MYFIDTNRLAGWVLCLFILAVRAQSGCSHDSCYNALFPCDSPFALAEASTYCSTVGRYGATNYPARATAACGNSNKRPYVSACACSVACPSGPTTTSSSNVVSALTTLTTSSTAPGGNAQSSPNSSTSVTLPSSTSASGIISSTASGISSPESSVSSIPSSSATTPGSTIASTSSQHPVPNKGTVSRLASSFAFTFTGSAVRTALTVTASASSIIIATSSNVPSMPPNSNSSSPGRLSSISLSTFTPNTSRLVTVPPYGMSVGSSSRWANMTYSSGTVSSTSANVSMASSTLVDPNSVSVISSAFPSSSIDPEGVNSTMLLESSSAPLASSFDTTPTRLVTRSGSHFTDATCTSTSTPTPNPSTLRHSSFFHYPFPNLTAYQPTLASTGVQPTSVSSILSRLPLNQTSSTQATPTTSALLSCTSTSSDDTIENGDFEDGLSPWSIDLVDIMSTSYSITSPGANGSCGAFHVRMRRNSQTNDLRSNLRLVSPLISAPGTSWAVSFWVRFDNSRGVDSYVNLFANGQVAHRVDAADPEAVKWTRVEFPYTSSADDRMLQLVFSFVLGDTPSNDVWIDKVAMDVTTPTSAGPVFAIVTPKPGLSE